MFTTTGGQTVSCLTDNSDGSITLRLLGPIEVIEGKRQRTTREVVLLEPTAWEYATLRDRIVATDREYREKFPVPDPPDLSAMTDAEARTATLEFQRTVMAVQRDRDDYVKGADSGNPYGLIVIEAVRILGGEAIEISDLPADALLMPCCTALLEMWEAPLGGPAVPPPAAVTAPAAEDAPSPPPSGTAPDSPEPAPSSPPGTEPSIPSPPST